jgi:hypothetical protein
MHIRIQKCSIDYTLVRNRWMSARSRALQALAPGTLLFLQALLAPAVMLCAPFLPPLFSWLGLLLRMLH